MRESHIPTPVSDEMDGWAVAEGGQVDLSGPTGELRFGRRLMSWKAVEESIFPELYYDAEPPGDDEAREMNELRALIVLQCAETEAVLGEILRVLDTNYRPSRSGAGGLLNRIESALDDSFKKMVAEELAVIRRAIKLRNHAVHSTVNIGYSWAPYATGEGEWIPVISTMEAGEYSELDLLQDLAVQQDAVVAAVRILHELLQMKYDDSPE